MLFVGVALLVAIGLGLLVSADAGSLIGLNQAQFGQLIVLVILAIIFAAGAFSRRQRFSSIVANVAAWGGIFVLVLVGYTYREDLKAMAAQVFGELSPTSAIIDSHDGTATFRRGLDGHFLLSSEVNGAQVPLLFDTGASAVVLSYADAKKAGIDVTNLTFDTPVTTANGTGRAAVVTLDQMVVGGIKRRNVPAFVAERGALDGSLLGMTFLSTLSRYSVTGDRLELADLPPFLCRRRACHSSRDEEIDMPERDHDRRLLRQAFDVARRARDGGDHPFGSVLADSSGEVLREQGNGYTSEGGDRTAHAEKLLASWAAKNLSLEQLQDCTLYTSAEPCAMCSGAIYWAGIGRVVFGQTERGLKAQTGAHEENPTLDLPCHIVFEAGQRPTEIVGPLLADEAAKLQADFWSRQR